MKHNKKPEKKFTPANRISTRILLVSTILLSIIPAIGIFQRVYLGDFAFWYDPARDMLSALTNLQKPTLIGPTSGIPGVFYGPYWIWLISVAQMFSKDPRIVMFIIMTIPYLVIFPFILSKYISVLRPTTIAIVWLFFLLHYNYYFTDLWNPYPAPLLLLLTILLIYKSQFALSKKYLILFLATGFTAGILVNFHLSLGIGMMLGILLYLLSALIINIIRSETKLQTLLHIGYLYIAFLLGFILAFLPYIIFEVRHQFQQTLAFSNAFMSYGGVVTLQGLSSGEIINNFIERGADLINVTNPIFLILLLIALIYTKGFRNTANNIQELKLLLIALSIFIGIAIIYLTAKNPIWEYHFTGIEILFLIIFGVIINKMKWIKSVLSIWIIFLLIINVVHLTEETTIDTKKKTGTFAAKQHVTQGIIDDAGSTEYVFYVLNPSIYMYDYSYLFKYLANKDIPYDPGFVHEAKVIYLIIPPESKNTEDFANYRAPKSKYKSVNQTIYPDGTRVVKNVRL